MAPTPVFLPGESHGQRSLVGFSPRGCRVRHGRSDPAHMCWSAVLLGGFYNASGVADLSGLCGLKEMERSSSGSAPDRHQL